MEQRQNVKWWYKIVLGISIVGEMSVVMFVGWSVYSYWRIKQNVLGASIVQLHKENLIYTPTANLRYFYESKAGETENDTTSWLDTPVNYTINKDALNERYDYPITAESRTYRIITLGDSFTFGHYVNTVDNWPERLEDLLNISQCSDVSHVDVINLGEAGYDAEYDVQKFILRGLKYQPDLVIWFLHGDRWNELMNAKRLELEKTLTEDEIQKAAQEGEYYLSWRKAMEYVYTTYSPIQLFEQQQAVFARLSHAYTGKLLIVSLPDTEPLYKMRLKYFVYSRQQTYYSDQLPNLRQIQGLLPDGHPSVVGHSAIARSIVPILNEKKLLTCQQ